jgi:thiamine pyrophosphate-dependent acetolactate synthase large subunit-like protein
VLVIGDVARDYIDRDGAQAFDLVGIFAPLTKLARQVNKTERIVEVLHDALRMALSGKRGPVFVDIPRDLLDNQTLIRRSLRRQPTAQSTSAFLAMRCHRTRGTTHRAPAPYCPLAAGCGCWASEDAVALANCWTWRSCPHTDTTMWCPITSTVRRSRAGVGAGTAQGSIADFSPRYRMNHDNALELQRDQSANADRASGYRCAGDRA